MRIGWPRCWGTERWSCLSNILHYTLVSNIKRGELRIRWWSSLIGDLQNGKGILSKGGRLTLIKSTLSNLPIYFMSILTIPASITRKLEKSQYQFLWGCEKGRRKYHLVKWSELKRPFSKGSLGLKSIA